MNQPEQKLSQKLLVPQIVAGAMAASTLIFFFLTYQAHQHRAEGLEFPASFEHPLAGIFGGMSVLLFLGSFVVPQLVAKQALKAKPNPSRVDLFGAFFQSLVIRLSLLEAIAIFGMLVGQASKDLNYSYVATAAALLGYAFAFPTAGTVRDQLKVLSPNQQF